MRAKATERREIETDLVRGARDYEQWRKQLLSDPDTRAIYEQEAAKKELWLQLVEARMDAGLTQAQMARRLGVSQAQVSRIEQRGYDAYTLTTLRKYVQAIGNGLRVEVKIVRSGAPAEPPRRRARVAPTRRAS